MNRRWLRAPWLRAPWLRVPWLQRWWSRTPPVAPQTRVVWRRFADWLAPTSIAITPDSLRIDATYTRILSITGYPRSLMAGFLTHLIDRDEAFDLSVHLLPQESGAVVRQLTRRLVQLQSSRLLDERHGLVGSAERTIAYSDVEQTRDRVQRGDERLLRTSVSIRVLAATPQELEARTNRLLSLLQTLQLEVRPATFEQDLALRTCLPEGHDHLGRGISLDSSSVARAFPFSASGLPVDAGGIVYGSAPNGAVVILDPFGPHFENANHVVFAKSGAGKSFFCKVTALRQLIMGTEVVIIDPEDEYAPLCLQTGGQFIGLAPGSGYQINPFDLPIPHTQPDGKLGDVLAEKIQSLHTLLDLLLAERGPTGPATLTQREKSLLDHACYETYRRVGIGTDVRTHQRPAPLLRDLYAVLLSEICGPDVSGLASRLRRYVDGSLSGLFAGPTNVTLSHHLVVFGIRQLDSELRPLGLFLIADFVETRVRNERRPRLLYIDEAWTLMQFAEGGRFLSGLARRCRKWYLGLVTITQNAEDFLASEQGRTVIAQSSLQILLKQDAATVAAVANAFTLSRANQTYLLTCGKGDGIICARGSSMQFHADASPLEYALATTDPRDQTIWSDRAEAETPTQPLPVIASEGITLERFPQLTR